MVELKASILYRKIKYR